MSDEEELLPTGWEYTTVGDVTHKKIDQIERSCPLTYIDIGSVDNLSKSITEPNQLAQGDKIPSRARQLVATNDVLVSMTRPNLNAVAIVPPQFDNSIASTGFDVLRAIEVEPRWLFNIVRSNHFIESLSQIVQGALYPAVRPSDIREYKIPLPPLAEQRRIVAKIEELQERRRKAREALAEVRPLLEQFRQSLLAAAFRGDLTADWRAANPNVEPASELLNRIRQERRQKWEQLELAKYKAKGKEPPKDWKERYQEPDPTDNLALPDIPTSWCWCALEELATHQSGYAFKSNHFSADGIQVIKLGNLYQGRFDLRRDPAYLPVDHVDAEAVRVLDGDILVSQTGTRYKRDYGFFVLVPHGSEPLLLNQRVLAVRPVRPTLSEWFVYSSQLKCYRDYFFSTETGGVNQGNVGVGGIMRGPIPLAPEQEITEISLRLAEAYASINEIGVSCEASETELSQLDQSILAKAFRGELVTQDPDDEPATVLLERIGESQRNQSKSIKKKTGTAKAQTNA